MKKFKSLIGLKSKRGNPRDDNTHNGAEHDLGVTEYDGRINRHRNTVAGSSSNTDTNADMNTNTNTTRSINLGRLSSHFSKGKHHRSSSVHSMIVHNGQQEAYDPSPPRETTHAQQLNTTDWATLSRPNIASVQGADNTQRRNTHIRLNESHKYRHQQHQQDRTEYLHQMQHRAGMERQNSITVPRSKSVSGTAMKRMSTQTANSRQGKPIGISGHRGQHQHEQLSILHPSHRKERFTDGDGYVSSHGERMSSAPLTSNNQGSKRYLITESSLYGNGNPYQMSKPTPSPISEAKDKDTGPKLKGQDQDDRPTRGGDDQDVYYMGRFVQDPYLEYTASPTGTTQRQSAKLQHISPRISNATLDYSFDSNPSTYTGTTYALPSSSTLNTPSITPPGGDTESNGARRDRIRKTMSVRWDAQERMWTSTPQPTSTAISTITTVGSATRPETQSSISTSRPPRVKGPRQMPDFVALERLHRLERAKVWAGLSTLPGDIDRVDRFTINIPEYGCEAGVSSYVSRQRHTMCANEYTAPPNLSSHRYGRGSDVPTSGTKYSSSRSTQPGSSSQRNDKSLTSRNRQSRGTLIPRHSMPGVTSRHNHNYGRDANRTSDHGMTQEEEEYNHDMDLYINGHDQDLDNHRSRADAGFQIQQEAHGYVCSMGDTQRQATKSQGNHQDLDEDVFHDFDSSSSESKYSYAVEELVEIPRSPSLTAPPTPPPKMALKPPSATTFASSPVSVPKKTSSPAACAAASSPATSASSKTTNTDPKRHSNTTSRGSARRIIYSADVEQGLPEGHIAREGKFEIVPSNRLSNSSSRAAGNRSSRLGGRGVTATSAGTDYEGSTVVVRTDRKGKGKAIAVSTGNNQITHGRNKKFLYELDDLEEQVQEPHFVSIQSEDPEYKVEVDADIMAMVAPVDTNVAELEAVVKARPEPKDKTEVEKAKRHSVEDGTLITKTGDDFSKNCAGLFSLPTEPCMSEGNVSDRSSWSTGFNTYDTNQIGIINMFLHAASSSAQNLVAPRITGFLYHGEPRMMNKAKKLRSPAHQSQKSGELKSSMCDCQNQTRLGGQEGLQECSVCISVGQSTKQRSDHQVLRTHSSTKRWRGDSQTGGRGQGTVVFHTQLKLQHQRQQPPYTVKPRKNIVTPLIQSRQSVKMQSLLKAVEKYSWPPAAAPTLNSSRSSESGSRKEGTTQRSALMPSHYHFSAFSWTNPLDFPLHPQECDRPKLHWDTSSESTTETRRYRTTAATSTHVEDSMPPSASVLIMGMTGAELIDSVKFENDHPGSLGYYGPLEFNRDEENRQLKIIAEQEKQKEDKKRKRAAAREKSPWAYKCRSLVSNLFLGRNINYDSGRPSVSGAEESSISSLSNRNDVTAGTVSRSLVNRIQSPIRKEVAAFMDTPNPGPANLLSDENKEQELGGQMDG